MSSFNRSKNMEGFPSYMDKFFWVRWGSGHESPLGVRWESAGSPLRVRWESAESPLRVRWESAEPQQSVQSPLETDKIRYFFGPPSAAEMDPSVRWWSGHEKTPMTRSYCNLSIYDSHGWKNENNTPAHKKISGLSGLWIRTFRTLGPEIEMSVRCITEVTWGLFTLGRSVKLPSTDLSQFCVAFHDS